MMRSCVRELDAFEPLAQYSQPIGKMPKCTA